MKLTGNFLIIAGICLLILGLFLRRGVNLKWLGRLPGDIIIHRGGFTFYFPLATGLVLSLILSLVLFIILRFIGRN